MVYIKEDVSMNIYFKFTFIMYNIVSNQFINQEFKKSNYYKTTLGKSLSVKKNSRREFRLDDEEKFIKFYLDNYRSVLYRVGKIGKLNFFVDHYLKEDLIIFFYKEKDFVFEHSPALLRSQGVNSYLSSFIEKIETEFKEEIETAKGVNIKEEGDGDPDNIMKNPGAVTYEDIKKYYKTKNKRK